MRDPEFLAVAAKAPLAVDPVTGEYIARFLEHAYGSSDETIAVARKLLAR